MVLKNDQCCIIVFFKDIIGEGAFSQVFRGHFQGAEVAIKRLKVPLSSQDRNYFAAEVSTWITEHLVDFFLRRIGYVLFNDVLNTFYLRL